MCTNKIKICHYYYHHNIMLNCHNFSITKTLQASNTHCHDYYIYIFIQFNVWLLCIQLNIKGLTCVMMKESCPNACSITLPTLSASVPSYTNTHTHMHHANTNNTSYTHNPQYRSTLNRPKRKQRLREDVLGRMRL